MPSRSYVEELEFDLPSKLLEELVSLFDQMPSGKLNAESLMSVDEAQGVYQIFKDEKLVYIGKTDSEAGLKKRLQRHSVKVQGRLNLDVNQVTFKAIRVFVFTAMDLESLLIKYYKEKGLDPEWQNSGFGSNDPGRERDGTKVNKKGFDYNYRINLDIPVKISTVDENHNISVADALSQAKKQLPYNIRFETATKRGRAPHQDLLNSIVSLPNYSISALSLLKKVKSSLGKEWQITALPGYVIIYKENSNKYEEAIIINNDEL